MTRPLPTLVSTLAGVTSALAMFWLPTDDALACACCTNRAGRYVEVEPLTTPRLAFVAQGAADHPIDLKDFGPALQLAVRQTKTEIVFAFRGDGGRTSEVTLTLPGTISIFEVDPRGGEPDSGLGPTLYKEWQLTETATAAGGCGRWSRAVIKS